MGAHDDAVGTAGIDYESSRMTPAISKREAGQSSLRVEFHSQSVCFFVGKVAGKQSDLAGLVVNLNHEMIEEGGSRMNQRGFSPSRDTLIQSRFSVHSKSHSAMGLGEAHAGAARQAVRAVRIARFARRRGITAGQHG